MRYPELSKLPKATGIKSINFRRQTPGTPSNILSPAPLKRNILDPTHPAANASFNSFPSFRSNEFGIRVYPMALLDTPDVLWQARESRPFDTWHDRMDRAKQANEASQSVVPMLLNNHRSYRISMSYLGINSRKRTSAERHIKKVIAKKIKTSINLIVVRGADVTELGGRPALAFSQQRGEHDQTRWILRGWSYVFFPTLEIYRMSYHDLIPKMRSALQFVWTKGCAMEKRWTARLGLQNITNASGRHKGGRKKATNPETARVASPGWRTALDAEADEDWRIDDGEEDRKDEPPAAPANPVIEPLLSFPSLQRLNNKESQWPLLAPAGTLKGQESWGFTGAAPTATEAEEAWANKYPVSVRDMAKRKLFRSQAVFRPPPERKRTDNKK